MYIYISFSLFLSLLSLSLSLSLSLLSLSLSLLFDLFIWRFLEMVVPRTPNIFQDWTILVLKQQCFLGDLPWRKNPQYIDMLSTITSAFVPGRLLIRSRGAVGEALPTKLAKGSTTSDVPMTIIKSSMPWAAQESSWVSSQSYHSLILHIYGDKGFMLEDFWWSAGESAGETPLEHFNIIPSSKLT